MEDWKKRACRGRWPARATPRVWRSGAWCAVRPAGGAGAEDGGRSARAGFARAHQRESERLVMGACREPCDPWGLGRVQPFSQSRQHHGDLVRRGFQTGQGSGTPGSERGTAGRTSKGLDPLGMAMRTIAKKTHERVRLSCRRRGTLGWDCFARGVHADGALPAGFSSHSRGAQAEALALHATRPWR
jgi:hypothetical protein